ncbi:MAG: molybdopterin biosynthesis protein [Clostridia bacterium]|nr:molybdopterin biosynthesis protein [Clostridia bacterium]
MKHNYLENIALNEAEDKYFSHLIQSGFCCSSEIISSSDANGRILKNAVYAKICSPHYNACAMDGIAVKAEKTYTANEQNPVMLKPEDYTVVDTGDPLPENCNAVIMVENLIDKGEGGFEIISAVHPWQNVRQIGEDICMGDMIAPSGTILSPSLCGALLAGGVTSIEVIKKPVAAVIPTGDEIVMPTESPSKGEIIEFNSTVFKGMLQNFGAEVRVFPIIKDKKELISAAVKKAVDECDIVLISAGSSAGRDDYTSEIIASLGTVCVHGIAVKPGKPAVLGEIDSTPVVGLPGYPVSAIVIMEQIVKKLVSLYYSIPADNGTVIKGTLSKRVVSSLKYTEFIRVQLGRIGGKISVSPLPRGAGIISSFTKADGILEVDKNLEGIESGEQVSVRLLKPLDEIENTLIVTGSHDPLIDEIADILKKEKASFRVCSSHVGSMGAIYALKDGLAHLGGIHLLDTDTGEYNKSYVKKYFPDDSAVIKKGIGRVQGLMVKKGNPLNIQSFADISNVKYVNRQRGAGTRILCDYLIKKFDLDPDKIEGYYNEEFTHTAVAALIAAGNADAGLGIYSAAKIYDLDFIPLCTEKYEFLVSKEYENDPMVTAFLRVLSSDEMRIRLKKMGGYTVYEG